MRQGVARPYTWILTGDTGIPCSGFMFFGLGFICCFGIYFFVPDFTGRSFAQIDECFYKRVPARKFKSFECDGDYGRDLSRPGAAPYLEA